MEKIYSIQGFEGSFHQEAAYKYFNNKIQMDYCTSFKQTFSQAVSKKNYGAVVAIENINAGSILSNYTLLKKSNLHIVGEIYLKIKQHLLANKGIAIKDIKEVHSHPMALLQCSDFLEKNSFKLVETDDTALSAKYIKQHHCKYIAAIAGNLAAQQNELTILVANIHSDKNNTTRFLVLEKTPNFWEETYNKASIYFQTNHSIGSLSKILEKIAAQNINLSKLQSFPVSGSNFQYYFNADLEFDTIYQFKKINETLLKITTEYKVLGVYKKGKQY